MQFSRGEPGKFMIQNTVSEPEARSDVETGVLCEPGARREQSLKSEPVHVLKQESFSELDEI